MRMKIQIRKFELDQYESESDNCKSSDTNPVSNFTIIQNRIQIFSRIFKLNSTEFESESDSNILVSLNPNSNPNLPFYFFRIRICAFEP